MLRYLSINEYRTLQECMECIPQTTKILQTSIYNHDDNTAWDLKDNNVRFIQSHGMGSSRVSVRLYPMRHQPLALRLMGENIFALCSNGLEYNLADGIARYQILGARWSTPESYVVEPY
jgi:hypothetical protein